MFSPFIINDRNLFLDRFPLAQVNRSLQAWDAADEYLINHIEDQELVTENSNILIFNDHFGALTTSLTHANVFCVNDSYISQQGILHNIEQNHLSNDNVSLLNSLAPLPENIDLILYKIPKSKSMLIEQLIKIKQSCSEETRFIATDKAKDIHSSTLKLFEKYLGETKTSLAVKKARLVFSQLSNKTNIESPFPTIWPLEDTDFSIYNHANVYAREKLDIGARYFMKNLPKVNAGTSIVDLGCGNGVIGLTVLSQQPQAEVLFIDESHMAIASAEESIKQNLPEQLSQCSFQLNDCLTDVLDNSVDLILCNPPFHQQNATTDHIAWQMFRDSYRVLKKGGELRIIGNRQLGYHIKLKRLFGNETLIASNEKFVTLSSIK